MFDSELDTYFSQLINQIKGLFNSKQNFNVPPTGQPSSKMRRNIINSLEGYTAPLHDEWRSSGGFTYQPNPTHPHGHMGVDMRAPAGTPVYPLTDGLVSNVGTDPAGGNVVNVQHANGVRTYYAHLSTAKVQKGDKVSANTIIGTVGNTGNASHTFPHLHFQVWENGQIQDPAKYFSIPQYTNISSEEQKRGPWLSPEAKQEAEAFHMNEHVHQRRVAFSGEVDKILKLANQYYELPLIM